MSKDKKIAKLTKAKRKLEDASELIADAGTLHDDALALGARGHRFFDLTEALRSRITVIEDARNEIHRRKDDTEEPNVTNE